MDSYRELWSNDLRCYDIIAACDIDRERAETRANQAHEFQGGTKPAVYTELAEMLSKHPELDCVDICALHRAHHILAVPALEAGKHVIIEKPLGITMRACKLIMDAADKNGKILSVAENYRLDKTQRARRWAVRQGLIGTPRMFFWVEVGEGLGKWGWRNFKMDAGGGWALDGGVHFTDLMRFILGLEAEEVYAINKAYEPHRYDNPAERAGGYEVDVEDAMLSTIKFAEGVSAQWTWVGSAPGQGFNRRTLYGSEGCIDFGTGLVPRTGEPLNNEELVNAFMDSISDEERDYYFPNGIENTVAIELKYFADAINTDGKPEVDGIEGMKSEAICMAVYESGYWGRPVTLAEIESCELEGYQKEINDELGIG
jgi:predicted dehydrogenase